MTHPAAPAENAQLVESGVSVGSRESPSGPELAGSLGAGEGIQPTARRPRQRPREGLALRDQALLNTAPGHQACGDSTLTNEQAGSRRRGHRPQPFLGQLSGGVRTGLWGC